MAKSALAGLFLCAWAVELPAAKPVVDAPGTPPVTVRVYNYARIDERIFSAGLEAATSVFLKSGVPVDFLDCTLTPGGQPDNALCHRLHGPSAIALRILPLTMLPPSGLPKGIFGFAMMSENDLFPIIANLYFDLIAGVADGRVVRRGALLGNMMAHEAGHLLLGANSHAKTGIMSIPWTAETLRQADRGELRFSRDEIGRMIENCVRRQVAMGHRIASPVN